MNFVMFCGSLVTDQIFISHKKWETFNLKWEGIVTATNGFFVCWKCFERSQVRARSLGWSILRTISSCQAVMTPGQMLPHLNNLFTSRRVLIKSLTMWQDLMNALTDGLWNISCAEFRNIYNTNHSNVCLETQKTGVVPVNSIWILPLSTFVSTHHSGPGCRQAGGVPPCPSGPGCHMADLVSGLTQFFSLLWYLIE